MKKAVLCYVPVPHPGYMALFNRHDSADIFLLTAETIKPIDAKIGDYLSRDFSCLPVQDVAMYLHMKFPAVNILIFENIEDIQRYTHIVMPDQDISHALKEKLPGIKIELDNQFLRYDWRSTNISKEVVADYIISTHELDRELMKIAEREAQKSSDFWRQVGAVVPLEDGFLAAFNEHMPTPMEPYIYGDMRLIMKPGERPEVCGAIHAEKAVFTQALRLGIVLEGRDIYVTTFPCLSCAQMIAEIGFRKLFFREGYSNENAIKVLRPVGIEIIQVK